MLLHWTKYCSYLSNTSRKWAKFLVNCNISRNWALFLVLPFIQEYLRSCVCVYIHVTCTTAGTWPDAFHLYSHSIFPKHSTARDLRSNRTTRPITPDPNASPRLNWNTFCLSHIWRCIPYAKYLQLQEFVVDLQKMLQLYTQIVT